MDPRSQTLTPLPSVLHRGLTAVSVFGFLSFLTTTTLFLLLTYRLISWYLSPASRRSQRVADEPHPDAALAREMGLPEAVYDASSSSSSSSSRGGGRKTKREAPNQFLILIYNLLLADIQQSLAFLLNATWLARNGIIVESKTCWAQGWFVSTGDLASSAFITTIAIHTYMSVVMDYRLPTWAFYTAVLSVWFFVYAMAVVGVIITKNGADVGGLYVRAAAWCWVNTRYESMRLYLHYLWMFICFIATAVLYILIFIHISRTDDPCSKPPSSSSSSSRYTTSSAPKRLRGGTLSHDDAPSQTTGRPKQTSSQRHQQQQQQEQKSSALLRGSASYRSAFLVYPLIYILCTAPLALGRVVTMTGRHVSLEYFCFAGAMIASNGWLDVLLFSTTRHVIIFRGSPEDEGTGLETFAFMRTPANRRYGNMVWVQGAGSLPTYHHHHHHHRTQCDAVADEGTGGWLLKLFRRGGVPKRDGRRKSNAHRSISQESLRRRVEMEGIQMETVTSVVIEMDGDDDGGGSGGKRGGVVRLQSVESIHVHKERAQSVGSL